MEQTNCALLPLDLFVHSYKTEFMAPHTCQRWEKKTLIS